MKDTATKTSENKVVKNTVVKNCGTCRNGIPVGGVSVMCTLTCKIRAKDETCKEKGEKGLKHEQKS